MTEKSLDQGGDSGGGETEPRSISDGYNVMRVGMRKKERTNISPRF